jgi:hypothetical protein
MKKALKTAVKVICSLIVLLIFCGFSIFICEIENEIVKYIFLAITGFFAPITMVWLVDPKSFEKEHIGSSEYFEGIIALIVMAFVFVSVLDKSPEIQRQAFSGVLSVELILFYLIALNHRRSNQ